ncbi:MAG: RNA-binding cell elongation regulator Jag/EloR [Eubacteriales bacterium]|nr:RNA-binding cell elongation regulator Jag/EloR [Eubacteriales bacterium]
MDYIEISAKNKDEAIIKASMQLETPSDELDIQIISEGSSGFLGFGSKPAIIRVRKKETAKLEEQEVEEFFSEPISEAAEPKKVSEPVQKPVQKKEEKVTPKKEFVKPEAPVKKSAKEQSKHREAFGRAKDKAHKAETFKKEVVKKESRPVELITDEAEIEEIKKVSTEFLTDVFKTMDLDVGITAKYNTEDRCLDLEFTGDDMGILIGKRGQTLDSLQYLTSLVVNKNRSSYVRIKLDTEDYRNRRKETLENLAKGIAYKVRKTRKPVVLEPMNPYERRIIHSALQGNRYVETFSEGEEPYRHVVVKMKGRRS